MIYVVYSSLSIAPIMKKGLGLYQDLFLCLLNLRFNFLFAQRNWQTRQVERNLNHPDLGEDNPNGKVVTG
jgi:hypothetical protein